MTSAHGLTRSAVKRHVTRILAALIAVVALVVASNNMVYRLIRSPEHIATAEMIHGWARLFKPMIYDAAEPEIAAFGHSWVRDIFDPVPAVDLTGQTFFNSGISGATSFESLRLVQNALAVNTPRHAFLELRAFHDAPRARLIQNRFDERILNVARDGSPNPMAELNRWVKINSSGAAMAFNARFLTTIYRLDRGEAREAVLPSYQRKDWGKHSEEIEMSQKGILGSGVYDIAPTEATLVPSFHDLTRSVELFCAAGTEVHIYEAPALCGGSSETRKAIVGQLRDLRKICGSKITFHSFRYPNAVTMESLGPAPGLSLFYRPDGHPRPSLGQMVLTRVLGLEDHPNAPPLPEDFGADLLVMDEQESSRWITARSDRCDGHWEGDERERTLAEMDELTKAWTRLWGP